MNRLLCLFFTTVISTIPTSLYAVATDTTFKEKGAIKTFTLDGKLGAFRDPLGAQAPHLIELATGKTLYVLPEKKKTDQEEKKPLELFIESPLAFNKKGTKLAAASHAHEARIWDTRTGKKVSRYKGHSKAITALAFNPQGKTFATGSEDQTVRIWGIATGNQLQKLTEHTGTIQSIVFSNDGTKLITGSADKTVKLWNPKDGSLISTISTFSWPIYEVALSPDSKLLAVVTLSPAPTVHLIDVPSGELLTPLKGHKKFIRSIAFNHDGTLLATGSEDTTIKLWDIKNFKEIKTFTGHTAPLIKVAFNAAGNKLFSSAYDYTFRTWTL